MARLTALWLLLAASCSGGAGESGPGDPVRGETVYLGNCVACHQADGRGEPAAGARLAADFTAPGGPLTKTDEDLLQAIRLGRTGQIGSMPPWRGVLSAQQQRDVLAFIRAKFTPPPPKSN